MVSVAILAAGQCDAAMQAEFGVSNKCLIEVGGRAMVRWVLDAVQQASYCERVVIVGPKAPLRAAGVTVEIVPNDGDNYIESVRSAVTALEGERALILAADIPLVSGKDLQTFVLDSLALDSDVCFPIVSWERMQARLPGVRKTWYELRDGRFTKGNAALGRRDFFMERLDRIDSLFRSRKHKQWMSLMCPGFVQHALSRSLAVAEIEFGLSRYLGARVRSVACAPELAADADEVSDVAFMRAMWGLR